MYSPDVKPEVTSLQRTLEPPFFSQADDFLYKQHPDYPHGYLISWAWRMALVTRRFPQLKQSEFADDADDITNGPGPKKLEPFDPLQGHRGDKSDILNIKIMDKSDPNKPIKGGDFSVECELIKTEITSLAHKVGETVKKTPFLGLKERWVDWITSENEEITISISKSSKEGKIVLKYSFDGPPINPENDQLLERVVSGKFHIIDGCFDAWIEYSNESGCDSYPFEQRFFRGYIEEDYHGWILPLFGLIESHLTWYLNKRSTSKQNS